MGQSRGGSGQLPPWDQAPFFQPVIESTVNAGPGLTQIVKADPTRTAILIGTDGGDAYFVTTDPNAPQHKGILLNNQMPSILLRHSDVGPFVNMALYVQPLNVGGLITIIEIRLAKWPGEE